MQQQHQYVLLNVLRYVTVVYLYGIVPPTYLISNIHVSNYHVHIHNMIISYIASKS